MKKRNQQAEKKLSLKKLQLMKINNMKAINGGGDTLGFDFSIGENEGDEPTPRPKTFDTGKK